MEVAAFADEHGIWIAVAVDVAPRERMNTSHSGKRPELLPRTIPVVAKDDRRRAAHTRDQIEIPVHLDVRGPDGETVDRERILLRRGVLVRTVRLLHEHADAVRPDRKS